jgi:hypothetical protein
MAIAGYLRKLVELKNQLVANLNSMGVVADENEKLNTLVPKVLECETEQNVEFVEGTDFAGTSSLPGFNNTITKIIIPDGTTTIGTYAFYNFTNLLSVKIPESVKTIGNYAFSDCTSLNEVTIECNNLTTGSNSFYNCNNLTKLIIAPGENNKAVNEIRKLSYSFTECEILDGVTSIGINAFTSIKITSLTIPSSVTSIGEYAFSSCTSLASITIPDSVTSIGEYAFSSCTSLASIIIPDSVTRIEYYTFYSCSSLTSITIPDSVTRIENYAFANCSSLTDIYYTGTEEQWNAITKGTGWNSGMGSSVSGGTTIHYNYVPE